MSLITIVTPTYNRANKLQDLFESLQNQTLKDFRWIVVDDGSNDNTKQVMHSFMKIASYPIDYYYKENGGKHTALNYAFSIINTELTMIVDSDDKLTEDAIEKIEAAWSYNKSDSSIAGLVFLRGYSESKCIGDMFPNNNVKMNGIDIQFRYRITGDKAEIWKSSVLKEYRFPEFPKEKFQGENFVWWQIANRYDVICLNRIIYITEYLEGGLTKSGRALRIRCPYGGMENSRIAFSKKFPLYARIKYAILYNCYATFAKRSLLYLMKATSGARMLVVLTYIPGNILAFLWYKKYIK